MSRTQAHGRKRKTVSASLSDTDEEEDLPPVVPKKNNGTDSSRPRMSRSKRVAAITAAANIRQTSAEDETVDYYADPQLLYDSRLYIWLPYFEGEKGTREYVDGEYHYARVDGYEHKKWKITYEHDGSGDYLTLANVLANIQG